jgi:hypothetical protein
MVPDALPAKGVSLEAECCKFPVNEMMPSVLTICRDVVYADSPATHGGAHVNENENDPERVSPVWVSGIMIVPGVLSE